MTADNTNIENLQKLLAFLKNNIINRPENAWFVDELRKYIFSSSSQISGMDKIEHYLGLDYKLDSSIAVIDYGFIKNETLRDVFNADCREMLRYRYGTRGHKIDFSEFCRYALMQVERLLNLYYSSKGSLDEIKAYIKRFNPRANLSNDKSLESINLAFKLWAFCSEFDVSGLRTILDRAREVRNLQSHGALAMEDENDFFFKHQQGLLKNGYPISPNTGWVNWNLLKETNQVLFNVYQTTVKNTPEHKRYVTIGWKKLLPFKEVLDALTFVCLRVKISLSQHISVH